MLYAVIPFSLFWLTGAWIGCNRAQRLTEGTEHYELSSDISSIDSITPTPKEKRNTIIFLISFVVLITYGILMKQSTSYALTVMLLLAGIIILIAGFPVDEGVKMLSKGIGSQASTLVLLLNFTVMMDLVNAGEGFTALGSLLSGLAQSGGATALALVSAVVADLELRPPLYWKFRSWLRCSVRWQLRQDFLWVFLLSLSSRQPA